MDEFTEDKGKAENNNCFSEVSHWLLLLLPVPLSVLASLLVFLLGRASMRPFLLGMAWLKFSRSSVSDESAYSGNFVLDTVIHSTIKHEMLPPDLNPFPFHPQPGPQGCGSLWSQGPQCWFTQRIPGSYLAQVDIQQRSGIY